MTRCSIALVLLAPSLASAQWAGWTDASDTLQTNTYPFAGAISGEPSNQNYYDGDLGDFDGDGHPDRILGARYGLLFNTGGGLMVAPRRLVSSRASSGSRTTARRFPSPRPISITRRSRRVTSTAASTRTSC